MDFVFIDIIGEPPKKLEKTLDELKALNKISSYEIWSSNQIKILFPSVRSAVYSALILGQFSCINHNVIENFKKYRS